MIRQTSEQDRVYINEFRYLEFVLCDLFVIWNLLFGI